jgi:hypothetical protein
VGSTKLTGTGYYLTVDEPNLTATIRTFHNGQHHTVLTLPIGTGGCVSRSIVVSPDGGQVAWVTASPSDDLGLSGDLHVANIDGTAEHIVRSSGVGCLGNHFPMWTVDSRGLLFEPYVNRSTQPVNEVDVTTGNVSPVLPTGVRHRAGPVARQGGPLRTEWATHGPRG